MKKKLLILVFALAIVLTLGIAVFANDAEAGDITISFVNSQDPTSATTSLDKTAHPDGKITVGAGEAFTLPTTSSAKRAGEAGYQLIWYTENGRTYKAGETVSFNEDTRLFRCVAKEASNADELQTGMSGDTRAVILTADIVRNASLSMHGQSENIVVLGGYNLTLNANGTMMGGDRTGKHVIGEGTLTVTNPDNKVGSHHLFNCNSHGWYNETNKCVIGVDVVLNAPNHHLYQDGNGSCWDGLPLFRIYGKLNVWSLGNLWNSTDKTPTIEIFEGAEVTLNGQKIMYGSYNNKSNCYQLRLNIYGGTINLPQSATNPSYWTSDIYDEALYPQGIHDLTAKNADRFNIVGGTFNVKVPDAVLRADNTSLVYNEAEGTYSVVKSECPNGTHNYVQAEAYEGIENTCTTAGIYYFRCECGAYKTGISPEFGHSFTILTTEKEATVSELGIKRVDCDRCDYYYTYEYSFSSLEVEVTITVLKDGKETEITLLAKDVFNFTVVDTVEEYSCTITGVKDGDGYTKKDIVKIQIPSGLLSVTGNAIADMTALKEIEIMDYATVTFNGSSIKNCPALEKITNGNGLVVFSGSTVSNCPLLAVLDLTKGDATFKDDAFKNNQAVKDVLMAEGNTYTFGANCFNNSGLEKVIFPDNSNIVFAGDAAFYGSPELTYAYFGANCISDKKIVRKPFDCCYSLKTVVLMDITYIDQYSFCCNGNASSNASHREGKGLNQGALNIYCHSETISIHKDVFANRSVLGVNFYTVSGVTSLANCKYTVYSGLPHAYAYGVVTESTCVTQGTAYYVTDCPCGGDYRENTYTTYSTLNPEINEVENEAYGTEVVYMPLSEEHTDSDIVKDVLYKNGMTKLGTKVYKCLYCDETIGEEEEATFPALFTYYGYSIKEYGDVSVSQCFGFEEKVYANYFEITGNEISYGVAVAAKASVADGKLVGTDGKAISSSVLAFSCTNSKYDIIDVKVTGLGGNEDTEIYFCGYYIVDGTVYYIDNGESGLESAIATTYNQILEMAQ
ncbi:MAG: leucine-rich repeat protein [Clostridia bacterium]|nr:leucine-rich repeat protein [Clostridia bacterium]